MRECPEKTVRSNPPKGSLRTAFCVYCVFFFPVRENHPSSRAGFFSKAAIFSRMDCGMRMDSFFW